MATDVNGVRRQIADGLRRVAQAVGVSQLELARRMGVTGPSVNVWMSGDSRLPLERLPELGAALGVGTDLLVYEMGLSDRPPERTLEQIVVERLRAHAKPVRPFGPNVVKGEVRADSQPQGDAPKGVLTGVHRATHSAALAVAAPSR